MATESFALSGLPPELRNKIWDMAIIDEARHRTAYVHQCRVRPASAYHWHKEYRIKPTFELVSAIMTVCHESRDRALKIFTMHLKIKDASPSGVSWAVFSPGGGFPIAATSCHLPDSEFRVMGDIYLSLEHDLFVMGLADEDHACNLYKYDIENRSILTRLPRLPFELNRVSSFRGLMTESLKSDQLSAVKRVMQIRHKKCTPDLHTEILSNHGLFCECGFGMPLVFGNTVDSTPPQVVFPNATIGPTSVFDVTCPRELIWTLSRIIFSDFYKDRLREGTD